MIDSLEMIRFFTEFIPSVPSGQALSQKPRPFVEFTLSQRLRSFASLRMTGEGLRVTRRRVQNDNHSIRPNTTQSLAKGKKKGLLLSEP
jgi:hypothetical protein